MVNTIRPIDISNQDARRVQAQVKQEQIATPEKQIISDQQFAQIATSAHGDILRISASGAALAQEAMNASIMKMVENFNI